MDTHPAVQPITEDDIVQFLVNTPEFFERHAEVLAAVQLTSPHGQRAVSLQERQAEMLREKIRHLELQNAQMIRYGHDNLHIADALHQWTCELMAVREPQQLPQAIAQGMQAVFAVPQAALRVWPPEDAWADQPFAHAVSDAMQDLTESLVQPYCGSNHHPEAARWLPQPEQAASVALLPLRWPHFNPADMPGDDAHAMHANEGVEEVEGIERAATRSPAFGLLVLASDDAERFSPRMGTDFLARMADVAAAALSRLHSR